MSEKEGDLNGLIKYHDGPHYSGDPFAELFFWPAGFLLPLSYKRSLNHKDIWKLRESNAVENIWSSIEPVWKAELKKSKPSLILALIKVFGFQLFVCLLLYTIFAGLQFTIPLLLPYMSIYFADPRVPAYRGYIYLLTLFLSGMCGIIAFNACLYRTWCLGSRIRSALVILIYKKALCIAPSGLSSRGKILNLMSTDAQIILDTFPQWVMGLISPIQIGVAIGLLSIYIGLYALIPLGVLLLGFPILAAISKKLPGARLKVQEAADTRVKLTTEYVSAIRIVKYYAWERPFLKKIDNAREIEMKALKTIAIINAVLMGALTALPTLALGITVFAYSFGNSLILGNIFSAIAYLGYLRFPLIFLPVAVTFGIQYVVSLSRIQTFLLSPDLQNSMEYQTIKTDQTDDSISCSSSSDGSSSFVHPDKDHSKNHSESQMSMKIVDGTFSWEFDPLKVGNISPVLNNINVYIEKGELVMVVGGVGSGKSSLAMSFLGELNKLHGDIRLADPHIAFASQEPFIVNTTVRDNITFGQVYDPIWYQEVIQSCALLTDFDLFPAGDLTEVAEKGSNLSGGQRQRLNVARAMYSDRSLMILDDPFSAVDSHVGEHMFHNVVLSSKKAGKTVFLITNQLHFLPYSDSIIVMKSGTIVERGVYSELIEKQGELYELALEYGLVKAKAESDGLYESKSDQIEYREVIQVSKLSQQSEEAPLVSQGVVDTLWPTSSFVENEEPKQQQEATTHETIPASRWSDTIRRRSISYAGTKDGSIKLKITSARNLDRQRSQSESRIITGAPKEKILGRRATIHDISQNKAKNGSKKDVKKTEQIEQIESLDQIETIDEDKQMTIEEANARDEENRRKGRLIYAEPIRPNAVSNSVYRFYFLAGGFTIFCISCVFNLIRVASTVGYNVWLAEWANPATADQFSQAVRRTVFMLLIAGEIIGIGLFVIIMIKFTLNASRNIHRKLLEYIGYASTQFYDTTPLGRITSRFSKDINLVDALLSLQLQQSVNLVFIVLGIVANLSIGSPYAIIVVAFGLILYVIMLIIFRRTSIQAQRLEAKSRAPIFTHFSETLEGVSTIRAYNMDHSFETAAMNKVDDNAVDLLGLRRLTQGFNQATSQIINVIMSSVVLMFVLFRNFAPSAYDISFAIAAIANSVTLVTVIGAFSYNFSEFEARMNAPERILEYKGVEQEEAYEIPDHKPPEDWPAHGKVIFDDLVIAYKPGVPVLKNINATIFPREKIGIVGRTGAGKSTLITALFRTMEPEHGRVIVDDIDISTLGLYDVRSKLSIIPQVPQLFMGTVRYNLDPFAQHEDQRLWEVIDMVALKDFIVENGGLDGPVHENGANFSVGQRQLLSMARCLLRKTHILLLDEATASLDVESDALLQKMIRKHFADRTVLTIAHRLITIMDNDRIMVLDAGSLVEFDTPKNLLKIEDGVFKGMIEATGPETALHLKEIAEGKISVVEILEEELPKSSSSSSSKVEK